MVTYRAQSGRPQESVLAEPSADVDNAGFEQPCEAVARRFNGSPAMPPNIHTTGDIELMSLLAGQSVGLVDRTRPASEILHETVNGAAGLIRELSEKLQQ